MDYLEIKNKALRPSAKDVIKSILLLSLLVFIVWGAYQLVKYSNGIQ